MNDTHELFPVQPGDRVVVNAGKSRNELGKVDTIDLDSGEVLVKMARDGQYKLFQVDELDKLA